MSYTYSTFLNALALGLVVDSNDADFLTLLPSIIDEAEQRLYRELDLVSCSVISTGAMTTNSRYATLPSTNGHIIVVDAVNIIDGSTKYKQMPTTLDVIDYVWPSTAPVGTTKPQVFYRLDDDRLVVGPIPSSDWIFEVIGTIRPTALSANNGATFLSTYLSDLFFAAAMCSGNALLLKNYGAESADPQQAMSWETKYQALFASAKAEELRKLFISSNSPLPASAKA